MLTTLGESSYLGLIDGSKNVNWCRPILIVSSWPHFHYCFYFVCFSAH